MSQVQRTSLEACRDIQRELGFRQAQVLNIFLSHRGFNYTNFELSKILGLPINQVTGRVKELREMGYLVYACSRKSYCAGSWKNSHGVETQHLENEP